MISKDLHNSHKQGEQKANGGICACQIQSPVEHVGLKGKTAEGLGPVRTGEAAEAHAVPVISR